MTDDRIISAGATREDEAIEASIRPKRLDEYLGQKPVREQLEEGQLGNQPGHRHDLPARCGFEALVDFLEARDAVADAEGGQGIDEGLRCQPRQQCALAFVEPAVGVVVGCGVG